MIYTRLNSRGTGEDLVIYQSVLESGILIRSHKFGCRIPDDEIPNLVAALQNYMSKRAKAITREGAERTKPCMSCSADAGKEVRHPAGLGRCPVGRNGR